MYRSIGIMIAGAIAFVAGQFGIVIDEEEQVAISGAIVAIAGAVYGLWQLYQNNKKPSAPESVE